jgi:diadenosine tetraphosphatase ApaH/serine/threonine PP2A family protein phosphatase
MTRTIVVGDIHGCYTELDALLAKANFSEDDRVVAVGDLIAKGTQSKQVLDLFSRDPRFSSVIGNHDLAILNFWRGQSPSLKASQRKVCDELKVEKEKYRTYLASLPYMIDLGTHAVVHAGVRPGIPLGDQSPEDLTELRTLGADRTSKEGTAWFDLYDGEKIILFGHWPFPQPRLAKRAIGLDTGCVYGHCLSAYILETGEFIQSPAQEVYEKPSRQFRRAQ